MKNARRNLITVIFIGLLLGILTSFGQTYLPGSFSQFANSYSVWLVFSFVAGLLALTETQAVRYGALVPVLALVSYYATATIRFNTGIGSTSTLLFWFIGGITAGPILAYLALQWRHLTRWAMFAPAAVSSLIISEGLYQLINLHYSIGYAFFAVGIMVFAGLYRKAFSLLYSLFITIGLSLILWGLYVILTDFTGSLSVV